MLAGILGALLTIIVFLELREAKTKIDDAGSESSIVG